MNSSFLFFQRIQPVIMSKPSVNEIIEEYKKSLPHRIKYADNKKLHEKNKQNLLMLAWIVKRTRIPLDPAKHIIRDMLIEKLTNHSGGGGIIRLVSLGQSDRYISSIMNYIYIRDSQYSENDKRQVRKSDSKREKERKLRRHIRKLCDKNNEELKYLKKQNDRWYKKMK